MVWRKKFIHFVAANVITFTFITLLQLAQDRLFFLYLILVHGGICLLIFNKRRVLRRNGSFKIHYKAVHVLLALYIPILLYKHLSRWLPYAYSEALGRQSTIVVAAVAAPGSLYNAYRFYKSLQKHSFS